MRLQLYALLNNGRLSNISYRSPGANDVPLAVMPIDDGPWAYDAVNKLAIPATLSPDEKTDRLNISTRILAAVAEVTWSRLQIPPVLPPTWAVTLLNSTHVNIISARQ